jgi:hypothetical protein
MPSFASIAPVIPSDGVAYCSAVTLPGTEADLGTPFAVSFGQALIATVNFVASGTVTTNQSYVICQMMLDGQAWIDLVWTGWAGLTGANDSFLLSAGSSGASAFQQSRQANTAPAGSEWNQCPLAGRLRFVGKVVITGGGSVLCSVTYKLLALN